MTVFVNGSFLAPAFQVGHVSQGRSLVHEALWLPIKKTPGVTIGTVCKVMQRSLLAETILNPLIRRRDKSPTNRWHSISPLLTGEPSCKDEARIGQKNGQVRQWARRGTRPRQPADQRYENAYLFGAICPARGVGAALALPYADTEAMQMHVDEVSHRVARGAHAVLLLDRAGWHTTDKLNIPKIMTMIF